MTKRKRIAMMSVATLALCLAVWWLFGFRVSRSERHTVILRRVFGRVTQIHVIEGWTEVERLIFPWSDPFVNAHNFSSLDDCAAIFPAVWQDRDRNGEWDTWRFRVGPNAAGNCQVEYRVDSTGDGAADFVFVAAGSDYEASEARIKARRGF
jgi:hypothetical protein